jgi:hypothetical protein
MATETHIHDGSAHRKLKQWHVHDGSAWRDLKKVYCHDGSQWRLVFQKWPDLTGNSSATFNISGSATGIITTPGQWVDIVSEYENSNEVFYFVNMSSDGNIVAILTTRSGKIVYSFANEVYTVQSGAAVKYSTTLPYIDYWTQHPDGNAFSTDINFVRGCVVVHSGNIYCFAQPYVGPP